MDEKYKKMSQKINSKEFVTHIDIELQKYQVIYYPGIVWIGVLCVHHTFCTRKLQVNHLVFWTCAA